MMMLLCMLYILLCARLLFFLSLTMNTKNFIEHRYMLNRRRYMSVLDHLSYFGKY
jgi:hypothetical protein